MSVNIYLFLDVRSFASLSLDFNISKHWLQIHSLWLLILRFPIDNMIIINKYFLNQGADIFYAFFFLNIKDPPSQPFRIQVLSLKAVGLKICKI